MPIVLILSVVVAVTVLVPLVAIVVGGARVTGTHECPAGEWTPIVRNIGTAMPRSIEVVLDGDDGVAGRWRVHRRHMFSESSVAGELAASQTFQRRWVDWRYRIEVQPERDVTATVR